MTNEQINEKYVIQRIITCNESIVLGEGERDEAIYYLSIEEVIETQGFNLYDRKTRKNYAVTMDDPSEEELLQAIIDKANEIESSKQEER